MQICISVQSALGKMERQEQAVKCYYGLKQCLISPNVCQKILIKISATKLKKYVDLYNSIEIIVWSLENFQFRSP